MYNEILEYAVKVDRREPNEKELAFYEYSIQKFADSQRIAYKEYLSLLTKYFNQASKNLMSGYTDHFIITAPVDYPKETFKSNYTYHAIAIEFFCRLISEHPDLKEQLFINKEQIDKLSLDYDFNKSLKVEMKRLLMSSNFYLTLELDFNASVGLSKNINLNFPVSFSTAVPDILLFISNLICDFNFVEFNNSIIFVTIKRNYSLIKKALNQYEKIIRQYFSGEVANPKIKSLPLSVLPIMHQLLHGGIFFVLFHEYAHIFFERYTNKNELELMCDNIAFSTILKMEDPFLITGALLGLYILIIGNLNALDLPESHPHPLKRYYQANDLYTNLQKSKNSDIYMASNKLLDIPHRYYEEEVFEMITQKNLHNQLESFFSQNVLPDNIEFKGAQREELIKALIQKSFSIPPPSDEYLVTVFSSKNKRGQYVHIDVKTASSLFFASLSSLGWAESPLQFGLLILAFLFSINRNLFGKLQNNEALLFGIIDIQKTHKIDIDSAQKLYDQKCKESDIHESFDNTLNDLINQGLIRQKDKSLSIKDLIIEFEF